MFELQPHKAAPAAVTASRSALHPAEYLRCSVMAISGS